MIPGFQRPLYLFHKWPLLPWRSLRAWVTVHGTASCPGLHRFTSDPEHLLQSCYTCYGKNSKKEKWGQESELVQTDGTWRHTAPLTCFNDESWNNDLNLNILIWPDIGGRAHLNRFFFLDDLCPNFAPVWCTAITRFKILGFLSTFQTLFDIFPFRR